MDLLRYTFVTDGSSDKALIPHITWLLEQNGVQMPIQPTWADLRYLRKSPKGLVERIKMSLELYPCDLLFVHRDAEREPYENRKVEIHNAVQQIPEIINEIPFVCVITVKMQEAWLLFNKDAIRRAAGNPFGREIITLPKLETIEAKPDPKEILYKLLKTASEFSGRRLKSFPVRDRVRLISTYINDFSPLRALPAFKALENDVRRIIQLHSWDK